MTDRDGLSVRDRLDNLGAIILAVLCTVVKMSADRKDRDGSRRSVTIVTDGDVW